MSAGYYEEQPGRADPVRCRWRAGGDEAGQWQEAATEYWGLGFTRIGEQVTATLVGPSPRPRTITWTGQEESWGVELEAHVSWCGVDKLAVLGELRNLPTSEGTFELGGVRCPVPGWGDLDDLVALLVEQGVLVVEPEVARALGGEETFASARTVQRHVRRVTGMGRKQVEQVRRARAAFVLLQRGVPIAEVAVRTGYADQPHLTRSMRVLAGRTPALILAGT